LGPRGLQVIASAVQPNPAPAIPEFIRTFRPSFPVGYNEYAAAMGFMQLSPMVISHVPLMSFIDRKGMIRDQAQGDDARIFNDYLEQNLRKFIEPLLKERAAAPAKKPPAKKK
jgi:hypothetical protein